MIVLKGLNSLQSGLVTGPVLDATVFLLRYLDSGGRTLPS